MSELIITERSDITAIADAVRNTTDSTEQLTLGEIAENINLMKGFVPIPDVAEVGQTIVVKEVDENGKPTEWEAVDLSAGGNTFTYTKTIVLEEDVQWITISVPCATSELLMWHAILRIPTYEGNPTEKTSLYVNPGGNANLANALPANSIAIVGVKHGGHMRISFSSRTDFYYEHTNPFTFSGAVSAPASNEQYGIHIHSPHNVFTFPAGTSITFWGVYAK